MTVTLKRQLTDAEKAIVIQQHGLKCFANGHTIAEGETVQFDHIKAYALEGLSEINNIAPMCAEHNLAKGTLSLFDFRAQLRLREFFATGDRLTLHDLLVYMKSKGLISQYGLPVSLEMNGDSILIESSIGAYKCQMYASSLGDGDDWPYFYATLPIELLDSDDGQDQSIGLQPRYLIYDKVVQLFRHFQQYPVLQPSLGRIVGSRIRLFDGQHKAAAILWNEYTSIECKVYTKPDIRKLNHTNIAAHDRFAQTRFYSSIMMSKLGAQFGQDFEAYQNLEDGQIKSEAGFISHLREKDSLTKGETNKRFRNFLYHSVLESEEENRLVRLVPESNRGTKGKPLTTNALENSLFANFLYREPVNENMATDAYKRHLEIQNMIEFMNMFDELALHKWNPTATSNNEDQRKLTRIIRPRFMKAWSLLLKEAICIKLDIMEPLDKERLFYRSLNQQDLEQTKVIFNRLINWKMWIEPQGSDIDTIAGDNDQVVQKWLYDKGLTVTYLLGSSVQ